mmetsp:Transcript_40958/g.101821  ORF Transcript_40958/g.101821 Transcript_40958/m.101821 type:complete len:202 (+) Transcript_40958:532-1137(+)
MPGPIVDDTVAVFHSLPLQPVGRFLSIVCVNMRRFSSSFCSSKSVLPNGMWTIPCLSVRNSSLPALNSLTASPGFALTVPALGEGIKPLGPSTLPSLASLGMAGGVASSTSKSHTPLEMVSIRSFIPTMSAPASNAAEAAAPSARTATRTDLPVPCGSETVVRICWSLYLGSKFKLPCSSAVSVNLAVAAFFRMAIASAGS